MGLLKEIAEPLISKNVPVIPLRPRTKIAFLTNWQEIATTDPARIEQWDQDYAEANAACVAFARPDGVWFLEIDKQGFHNEIEKQTGQKIPETFMVRSSPGRGHFYFKQTPASIAMGNVQAADSDGKELWSARVDNRYVVAPGSFHPTSGLRYETLRDVNITEAPDWLVDWCKRSSAVPVKTGHAELDGEDIIIEGGRNSALTSILGKARQVLKMDREQLYAYGLSVNEKRCRPPLAESEVKTISNSISGYAVKESGGFVFGQTATVPASEPPKPVETKAAPYPIFPRWVMHGTSVYEGLVKPFCDVNSRYPEFMFIPAMVMMLNYLAVKVRIEDKDIVPAMYVVCIGQKGRVIKSSSVKSCIEYFKTMSVLDHGGPGVKNANAMSLVWQAGSAEGLGLEMARTNNRNAILFYDELSTMIKKASIEKSTLKDNLLQMYDSGLFSNSVKSRKESYNFEPGTYCASLIACTTDKKFQSQWSMVSSEDDGFNDRFFFLYQPEILDKLKPYKKANTVQGGIKTKQLIDKAVKQSVYRIVDDTPLEENIERWGNRLEGRVEKMALYFAVDQGKDEIDEDCVERARAIAEYELRVKDYLKVYESTTLEGKLQQEVIQLLQRNKGVITEREMRRSLHPERHGTYLWKRTYNGLIQDGQIAESGTGTKSDPKQIILLRAPETEDE